MLSRYYYIKCVLDFLGALVLLMLVWWIILICLIIIKLESPHDNPMFIDKRVGKNQRIFNLYKLRTMKSIYTGADGVLDYTLSVPGRIMRKHSLDELPQLINILNGTMSFVGPRPLLVRYLPYYDTREIHRHDVKPGITGLAQINGRANLNWDKRFAYDVQYVTEMSFTLDVKIIYRTICQLLHCSNVMVAEHGGVTESFDSYRKKQVEN